MINWCFPINNVDGSATFANDIKTGERRGAIEDDIAEIDIHTFDKASQLDIPKPASIEEAEYSIPYVLGITLQHIPRYHNTVITTHGSITVSKPLFG